MLIKKLFTFVVILYCSYHSLVNYGSFYHFLLTPNSFVCIFSFCLQLCWKHITWLDLQILQNHSNLYYKLKTIYFCNANNFFLASITLQQIDIKMKHSLVIVRHTSISIGRNCLIKTWTSWDFNNNLKKLTQDNFSFSWQSMITRFWYVRLSFLTLYKYVFSLITSLVFPTHSVTYQIHFQKLFLINITLKNILHITTSNMAIQTKFTFVIPLREVHMHYAFQNSCSNVLLCYIIDQW